MAVICPTLTTDSLDEYKTRLEKLVGFSPRIHVDTSDGLFGASLVAIDSLSWPEHAVIDLHIMYRSPEEHIGTIQNLRPSLVILHAEAQGVRATFEKMHGLGIKRGVALLQQTGIEVLAPYAQFLDHVLIFSGTLGKHGGIADMALLDKVSACKQKYPGVEIGWDGGVSLENAAQIAKAGVDVLNVGGAIAHADDQKNSYEKLTQAVQ